MTDARVEVTTLSDISANMFAAFILILIMAAAAAMSRRPVVQDARPGPLTDSDLPFVSRQPLDAAAMIGILYDRRPSAPGTSIDILSTGVTVTRPAGQPVVVSQSELTNLVSLQTVLGSQQGPVRLYVFANDLYGPIVAALTTLRSPFRELSVPVALRGADMNGWSPDFEALAGSAGNLPQFKAGLARILGGGESVAASSSEFANRRQRSQPGTWTDDVLQRLRRIWRLFLTILSFGTAIVSISWIETKTRHRLGS